MHAGTRLRTKCLLISHKDTCDQGNSNMVSQKPATWLLTRTDTPVFQQAFHTYKVRTKTSLPQYRNPTMEVVRRFRDFAWLHQRLAEHNRGARSSGCYYCHFPSTPLGVSFQAPGVL